MASIWNLPARYEGPHCNLGKLIREEAYRHVDVAHGLGPCEGCDRDDHMRKVENSIWDHVKRGWARPLEDWSGMVFWNPVAEEFEPFSAALFMVWKDTFENLSPIGQAVYTGGPAPVKEAKADDYVGGGKQAPLVIRPDLVTSKVH